MSIHTNVLENGRWVTRSADPYSIWFRSRHPEPQQAKPLGKPPKAPDAGILTRTLVRSQVVKWILPARIRHSNKNDVLYITAESVEVKEAHDDYTLHHVATKDDFDSPIRAARIFGRQRQPTKPDIRPIIPTEPQLPREDRASASSEDDMMDSDSEFPVDLEVEQDLNQTEDTLDDEAVQAIDIVPLHQRHLPPHVLVLVLESGSMVFMYAITGTRDDPVFVSVKIPLFSTGPYLEQLGEHLAVDPRSRSMAVAAHEGLLYVFSMRSMDELEKQNRRYPRIQPVLSERAIRVDGTILQMEFLHPSKDDTNLILLLLVVAKNGRNRLTLYQWDSLVTLRQAQMKPLVQPLGMEQSMPLKLIPLIHFSAFILVSEQHIMVYKDLLTGSPRRYAHHLDYQQQPEETGISRRSPVWTNWARVTRNTAYRAMEDGIFLCREDGILHFLRIKTDLEQMIASSHVVDRLGINVDTAFAMLDVGPQKYDLLAVGGDGSDSGLWCFEAREHGRNLSRYTNSTPMTDAALLYPEETIVPEAKSSAINEWDFQRIFTCAGKGKHGSVIETRLGLPASRKLSIDLESLLENGILDVFAFENRHRGTWYMFLSLPKRTHVLLLEPDPTKLGRLTAQVIDEQRGLDLQNRTITAQLTSEGRIIQITERFINSVSVEEVGLESPESAVSHDFGFDRVMAAHIGVPGFDDLALIALKSNESCRIVIATIDSAQISLYGSTEVSTVVSCLSMTAIGNEILVFAGFSDHTLKVYNTSKPDKSLRLIIVHQFHGEFALCESIAYSLPDDQQRSMHGSVSHTTIACGLRDGSVCLFALQLNDSLPDLTQIARLAFGHTPVTVFCSRLDTKRFIVHCGDNLCSLYFPDREDMKPVAGVHRIWLRDEENPRWHKRSFSAVSLARDNFAVEGEQTEACKDTFVCIDGTSVHIATMRTSAEAQNVGRSLTLGSSPAGLLFSQRQKRLIVLSHEINILRPQRPTSDPPQPGKRTFRPVITFMDPHSEVDTDQDEGRMEVDNPSAVHDAPPERLDTVRPEFKPGEKFLGITEWSPRIEQNEWPMLIANTSVRADAKKAASGRLILFAIIRTDGRFQLKRKKEITHTAPIYAVAAHPSENVVFYVCATELCAFSLSVLAEGSERLGVSSWAKVALQSPGRQITVMDDFVYVSTAEHSLSVFEIQANTPNTLTYLFSDTEARVGIHHTHVPESSIVLASDAGNSLVGLWRPPQARIDNALTTVFEAVNLPFAITRLKRISQPPWYQKYQANDPVPSAVTSAQPHAFIGTSTAGSITQIVMLDSHEWPLLCFLQVLAQRCAITAPFSYVSGRTPPLADFSTLDSALRNTNRVRRHINGDLLRRLLERGGANLVLNLLGRERDRPYARDTAQMDSGHDDSDDDSDSASGPSRPPPIRPWGSPQDKWAAFATLAGAALELEAPAVAAIPMTPETKRQSVEVVMAWVAWMTKNLL